VYVIRREAVHEPAEAGVLANDGAAGGSTRPRARELADVFEREGTSHVGRLEPLRRLFEQTVMGVVWARTEFMLRRYIIDLEDLRRAGKRRASTRAADNIRLLRDGAPPSLEGTTTKPLHDHGKSSGAAGRRLS